MPQPSRAVGDAATCEEAFAIAEDAANIQAAEAARTEMRETGARPIPWEQVKAELGL